MGLFKMLMHWVSEITGSDGEAILIETKDGCQTLAMKSLRVLIIQDSTETWFAQSLDIDYAASGETLEDVQKNFERGLSATIRAQLDRFGNIDKIMKTPVIDNLSEFDGCDGYKMSHVVHDIGGFLSSKLPFQKIDYTITAAAA